MQNNSFPNFINERRFSFLIKVIFLSITLVLISTSLKLYAQKNINNLVLKGLDDAYNFNWTKAENVFQNIIDKYPEDPRGYHYKARVYAWYYLSSKKDSAYQKFVDFSDTTIDKANALLEKNPEDKNTLYILGSAYTYRAIVFAKAESYLDAIWASKKSESYLSEALKTDSTIYDAYLGLGLYNFAVGQIPSAFKWALNLAGINGNEKTGLNYLKIAAKRGIFAKVEAQYYLSQILSEVQFDYNLAGTYLKNLIQKYPSNLLFNYSYAVLKLKQKDLNISEKMLRKIIVKNNPDFIQIISFSNFLIGDIFYRRNEFDSAKVYYLDFLTTAPDKDYKGIASYRLAVCYEITGERQLAEIYFGQAQKGNMDIEDDIYARRKGEIYSKRTLSPNEVSLIKYNNEIEAGKYKQAYDSLLTSLNKIKLKDLKGEAYYYLAEASFYLGNYKGSISYVDSTLENESTNERWVKPFASYFGALSSKKLSDTTAVSEFVEKAEDFNDFDYQNKLKNMLEAIQFQN